MVGARPANQEGSFQTSLKYQQISYAGLAPSFLMPETFLFPGTVLSVTLRSFHFSLRIPWLTLPSVQVKWRAALSGNPSLDFHFFSQWQVT